MGPRHRSRGPGLAQALDREVYQVLRNIIDSREQYSAPDAGALHLTFATFYDEIRRSNSSLNRKTKKQLEDSFDRAVANMTQAAVDSDSGVPVEDMAAERGLDSFDTGAHPELGATQERMLLSASNGIDTGVSQERGVLQERPSSNALNRSIVGRWATPAATPDTPSTNESRQLTKRKANGEPLPKRRKPAMTATIDRTPPDHARLADMGGVDHVVAQLEDLLVMPMTQPEIYTSTKVKPPRGILIHGPSGCGKTMIANAVAAELAVNFISISAPSIVSGMSGESEKALRDHFDEAKRCAPCLVFIDEIDSITPKREGAQREMEKRIVAQLLTCMDDLSLEKTEGKPVIVLAATNRPDSLDAALRRGGRFDKEINMTVPTEPVREKILRALTRGMALEPNIDFALLAKRTPGFVGADLNDLVSTAGAAAIKRYQNVLKSQAEGDQDSNMSEGDPTDQNSNTVTSFARLVKYSKEHPIAKSVDLSTVPPVQITWQDFETSLPKVQPSSLREGFATVPSTTFADIGSLSTHINELTSTIIDPILQPSLYSNLGITPSSGTLLWGPPGNGKTLLAKAVANSSHANFISVKGPELLNKYVGESERAVRQVFTRARSSAPVIIFFDELDALVPRRDASGSSSEASSRVVNTMLTELDGVGSARDGIYVVAATNRPDIIDPAMLRPGRLDTMLFVGLPDAEGRADILRTLCKRLKNFVFSPEIADVARRCDRFSGADLEALLQRAGLAAIRRLKDVTATGDNGHVDQSGLTVADFEKAEQEVKPSVSVDEMKRYDRLHREWGN